MLQNIFLFLYRILERLGRSSWYMEGLSRERRCRRQMITRLSFSAERSPRLRALEEVSGATRWSESVDE